jgi:hypothetical protein
MERKKSQKVPIFKIPKTNPKSFMLKRWRIKFLSLNKTSENIKMLRTSLSKRTNKKNKITAYPP